MPNKTIKQIILPVFIGIFILLAVFPTSLKAQTPSAGAVDFEKRCYSCHNINGGDKKGPDLRGVTERRSKQWLYEFIQSPAAMNRKGDTDANALFKKFAPEVMPDQPLTPEQMDGIFALIESLTKKGETFIPAGAKLYRPIEVGDLNAGRETFAGKVGLNNGGTSCIACHNVNDIGRLGGGTLGPDLTAVNTKYKDPELISILQNPNFPTMTLFEVEGAAGCGKTFRLMEALGEALGATPLQEGQRVLALTFMHGARRRLNEKLRSVPGLKGRFECVTVDA